MLLYITQIVSKRELLLILLLSPSTFLCFWVWMKKRGRGQITKIISVHSKTKNKGEKVKSEDLKKKGSTNHFTYTCHELSFRYMTTILSLSVVALSSYWVCKYEYRWNRFTFLRGKLRDSLAPGVDPFSSHMLGNNNSLIE